MFCKNFCTNIIFFKDGFSTASVVTPEALDFGKSQHSHLVCSYKIEFCLACFARFPLNCISFLSFGVLSYLILILWRKLFLLALIVQAGFIAKIFLMQCDKIVKAKFRKNAFLPSRI